MSPDSFWSLTYVELRLILEGYGERRGREMKWQQQLAAWIGSVVTAPHLKEPIEPGVLLGGKPRKKKAVDPVKELDKALDYAFTHFKRD